MPAKASHEPKFGPKAIPGLFLGYHLLNGCRWKGDYLVVDMKDIHANLETAWVHVQRVKEVYHDGKEGISFPLHNQQRQQWLETAGNSDGDFGCPGAPDHAAIAPPPPPEPAPPLPPLLDPPEPQPEVGKDEPGAEESKEPDLPPAGEAAVETPKAGKPAYGSWEQGKRVTRKQKTTRPDEIPPELWTGMSVKQHAEAIAESLKASCEPKGGAEAASSSSPAAAAWTLREADGDDRYPRMPVMAAVVQEHREHEPDRPIWLEACVARPVRKAEISRTPAARAALEKEWQKLYKANTWDESTVMEWSEVAARAKTKGTKAHVGRIFEICVEKGSELPAGDAGRKYKGRVVFQGNQVRDESFDYAIFGEVSSAPSTMQAGRAADAYGLLRGHGIQQADAESAYTQADITGDTPTYVELPEHRWPASWKGMRRPVCRLVKALYGHPESGACWEKHCYGHLETVGFKEIDSWPGTFYHGGLRLLLVVYVDDFKMAGPTANLAKGWELIRKKITTDEPAPAGKYLGCNHKIHEREAACGPKGTRLVRELEYDMEDFLVQCVSKYQELAGSGYLKLKRVSTPFLDETKLEDEGTDDDESACPPKGGAAP